MSLTVKTGIGLVTVGTVGGIGYGIFAYSRDKGTEISKLIDEEFQYKLLDTTAGQNNPDKEKWTKIWQEYKEKSQNVFKLDGWKSDASDFDLTEALKEKCKELSKSKIQSKEEKLYGQVTSYCGRYISIKDQAKKENLKVIDTTKNDANDWTKFVGKDTTIKIDLANLEITAKASAITATEIKEGCKKAVDKNKSDTKYEQIYASYKVLCAN